QPGQEALARLVAAEAVDHPGDHVVDRKIGRGRGATLRQFLEDQRGVEPVEAGAADVVLHIDAGKAQRGGGAQRLDGEDFALVPVARMRHHRVAGKLPRGRLKGALFFGQREVHGRDPPFLRLASGSATGNRGGAGRLDYGNFRAPRASDGRGRQPQGAAIMADNDNEPKGPDLAQGIAAAELAEGGMLTGHVNGEAVLLVRHGGKVAALAAHCTHYHGPLADGLIVGDTIRCPWHHACFSLRTGEALAAPALSPLDCYVVSESQGRIIVGGKKEQPKPKQIGGTGRIVIIGGGAAGFAAAEMLRRHGFSGDIAMLSNDSAAPVDRPNLSKDYLAGSAPEDWVPLRGSDWYADNNVTLELGSEVTALDPKAKTVTLGSGATLPYDKLL